MPVEGQRASAAELEATGATEVTFDFRGTSVTIPLGIEAWPIGLIRARRTGAAIRTLLGRQRPPLRTRDDATELTHRMADACGVTPLPETEVPPGAVFGAVPLLIDLLDNHADDIAADLRRFYGIDYRDRWRGNLTLREIWVCVRRLDHTSALAVARNGGDPVWTRGDIIAARNIELWTRKHYEGRPWSKDEWKAMLDKRAAAAAEAERLKDRESYYASGQNMRDAGIDTDGLPFSPPGHTQPPPKRERRVMSDDPVDAALAVAKRNAARSQRHRKGAATNERAGTFRDGRYDARGSGWG